MTTNTLLINFFPQTKENTLVGAAFPSVDFIQNFGNRIQPWYLDRGRLPYHNFDHAKEVTANVREVCIRALNAGIQVNLEEVVLAALGHDAGYGLPYKALGFDNPEALSKVITSRIMQDLGASAETAENVGDAILGTIVSSKPITIAQKILRAADLKSLAGDFPTFIKNSRKLFQEQINLNPAATEKSFKEFCLEELNYLAYNMTLLISLTKDAEGPRKESIWHHNTLRNFIRLFQDPSVFGEKTKVIGLLTEEYSPSTFCKEHFTSEGTILVSVANTEERRETEYLAAKDSIKDRGIKTPVFVVPGRPSLSPLPDSSCDEVFIDTSSASREALRVLKADGVLYLKSGIDCQIPGFVAAENSDKPGWVKLSYAGKIKTSWVVTNLEFSPSTNFESNYPEVETQRLKKLLAGGFETEKELLDTMQSLAREKATINQPVPKIRIVDRKGSFAEYDYSFSGHNEYTYDFEYLGTWVFDIEAIKVRA